MCGEDFEDSPEIEERIPDVTDDERREMDEFNYDDMENDLCDDMDCDYDHDHDYDPFWDEIW